MYPVKNINMPTTEEQIKKIWYIWMDRWQTPFRFRRQRQGCDLVHTGSARPARDIEWDLMSQKQCGVYINNRFLFSYKEKNERMVFTEKWMELEITMWSEISQTLKREIVILYICMCVCVVPGNVIWEHSKDHQRADSDAVALGSLYLSSS